LATSAIVTNRSLDNTYIEDFSADYASDALRLFIANFQQLQDSQVLDIGPVCGDNINFLAQQVKRIYVCDMFTRLDRDKRKGLQSGRVWRHLDYPAETFDGILLWDLCDRLDDREVGRLVDLCHTMIKQGGILMLSALGEQVKDVTQPVINCFVIKDDFRLYLRPQPHLHLPLYGRQNRDVLSMLAPFRPVKSFTCRNGVREFLFRRD